MTRPLVVVTQNEGYVIDFVETYGEADAFVVDYSESKENAEYAQQCLADLAGYTDRLPADVAATIRACLLEQHPQLASA